MLSKADNDALTRVGPGTLMGNLMRQYWLPALLSRELAAVDSDPVRVMLLGEKLIAFRDTTGQVGLLANHCPHRGASLFFGRNEESGLRCVYHGWKFSADGTCIDMPNEPAESDFRTKVQAVAYPCRERGGIVWAYLGPNEPPPLPDIEANMLAPDQAKADAVMRECNWLQGLEGDIDTSHLGFLHMGALDAATMDPGTFGYYTVKDRQPHYAIVDTDGGTMYGAYRPAEPPMVYWRIAQFLFPCYALIPSGVLGREILTRAWVPMDDEHMMYFNMGAPGTVRGMDYSLALPNTTDWYGRPGDHREHGADSRSLHGTPGDRRHNGHSHPPTAAGCGARARGTRHCATWGARSKRVSGQIGECLSTRRGGLDRGNGALA